MFGRMLVQGRIAASHMPALQTHPEMNPAATNLQALFTALRRRLNLPYLIQMSTFHSRTCLRLILSSDAASKLSSNPPSPP
jgi:hypothetical protein